MVGKKPSTAFAKLVEDLPWLCQNYENGCREIKTDGEELEHHQGECIFRKVFCPCRCKIKKVMFKNVDFHLSEYHNDNDELFELSMAKGEKNKWIEYLGFHDSHFDFSTVTENRYTIQKI